MKLSRTGCLLFGAALAFGFWFRVYDLNRRPMHTDEAVQAVKFIALLHDGDYVYDPHEYHGPTLNYLTLAAARLAGCRSGAELTEATLRSVPAIVGFLLLLTPLLFFDGLGLRAAAFGSALLALSPAFVFYSRYYIHEMLLVCFTAGVLGGLWRYLRSGRRRWMELAGLSAGLMVATKETFILTVAAMLIAAALMLIIAGRPTAVRLFNRDGLLGLAIAALVWAALFSSFGRHPNGIADSILTYKHWIDQAGIQSVHAHPWYWYLDLLTWNELTERITWNEDILVVGAAVGFFLAFKRPQGLAHRWPFCVFLALFTLFLTAIYSAIPYKTPWCVLNFLYGMALLTGFAADRLLRIETPRWKTAVLWAALAIFGLLSPIAQSLLLNTRYSSHPSNPWVYAHTSPDVFLMDNAVRQAAAAHPDGKAMAIEVIAPAHDYWPLPWYWRDFTNVAYRDTADKLRPEAALVLMPVNAESAVVEQLYQRPPGQRQLYVPLFEHPVRLRPGVLWTGVVTLSLWESAFGRSAATVLTETKTERSFMDLTAKRDQMSQCFKFSHQAMNTVFEMWIQHADGSYAGRAARAAFNEADRLEQELSRYIENSDISRINRASAGTPIVVSPDTMACLAVAQEVYALTDAAFDISVGRLVQLWRQGEPTNDQIAAILAQRNGAAFALDKAAMTVTVLRDKPELDLGGVAKGYAIDRMTEILQEWGIERALLHGGASSVAALAAPFEKNGWPITLSNPHQPDQPLLGLELAHQVLSCSGLQRGGHIVNPATGQAVTDKRAVWLLATGSSARADAITTALMVMSPEKIASVAASCPDASILLIGADPAAPPAYWGTWPTAITSH